MISVKKEKSLSDKDRSSSKMGATVVLVLMNCYENSIIVYSEWYLTIHHGWGIGDFQARKSVLPILIHFATCALWTTSIPVYQLSAVGFLLSYHCQPSPPISLTISFYLCSVIHPFSLAILLFTTHDFSILHHSRISSFLALSTLCSLHMFLSMFSSTFYPWSFLIV